MVMAHRINNNFNIMQGSLSEPIKNLPNHLGFQPCKPRLFNRQYLKYTLQQPKKKKEKVSHCKPNTFSKAYCGSIFSHGRLYKRVDWLKTKSPQLYCRQMCKLLAISSLDRKPNNLTSCPNPPRNAPYHRCSPWPLFKPNLYRNEIIHVRVCMYVRAHGQMFTRNNSEINGPVGASNLAIYRQT